MDHKKVSSFAAYDENGQLYMDGGNPIAFMAEFNDGIFRGDIGALDGTFSGVLTANAVDAVQNININGNAVAISAAGAITRYPTTGYCPEGQTATVFSFSFNIPDTDGVALLRVALTLHNGDNDNSQKYFDYRQTLDLNGVTLYDSTLLPLIDSYYAPQRFIFETVLPVTVGNNMLSFYHYTTSDATTPYPYYQNISYSMDFVRK